LVFTFPVFCILAYIDVEHGVTNVGRSTARFALHFSVQYRWRWGLFRS